MEPAAEDRQHDGLGSSSAAEEALSWDFYDLDFAVHRSRRYYEKLAAFYGGWRDRMRIVTAVAGSSTFLLLAADSVLGTYLAAFVALWAVLDIIMMPDMKGETHNELSKRFTALAREIAVAEKTRDALNRLIERRLVIEEGEPPCKRRVDLEARNDECRARGVPAESMVPLSRAQRLFGRYLDFGLSRLEQWKAEQERAEADVR